MFQFSPFFVLRAFTLWNSFPNLQFLSIVVLCRPPCTRCTRAISILIQGECAACVQSKTGEGKKNQQLYFFTTPFTQPSLADLLFFYEFKMFVHSSDSNRRDSISQKNLIFPPNDCRATRCLVFGGGEPGCLVGVEVTDYGNYSQFRQLKINATNCIHAILQHRPASTRMKVWRPVTASVAASTTRHS